MLMFHAPYLIQVKIQASKCRHPCITHTTETAKMSRKSGRKMSHASCIHLVGECKFTRIGIAERCSFSSLEETAGFPVWIATPQALKPGLDYVRKMRGRGVKLNPMRPRRDAWRLICTTRYLYCCSRASGLVRRLESIIGTLMGNSE